MEAFAITDVGKVRKQNQDAFYLSVEEGRPYVLLVCDGMGGHKAGNVASELAVKVFQSEAEKRLSSDMTGEEIGDALRDFADEANSAVYQLSHTDDSMSGMGTTLVACVVKGDEAVALNIGDSRLYTVTKEEIRQVTKDHSLVEDMVDRGEITRQEARYHPNKNYITRAVGTVPGVESDLFSFHVEEESFILLSSDGLTNIVEDWEIQFEVMHAVNCEQACAKLVELALKRGAPDNVTVVLYKR